MEPYSIFWLPRQKVWWKLFQPSRAYHIFKDYSVDLLTGRRVPLTYQDWRQQLLSETSLEPQRVIHFMYDQEEAIDLCYQSQKFIKNWKQSALKFQWKWLQVPQWAHYKEQFEKIYQHLLDGDCYQVNLTSPWLLTYEPSLSAEEILSFLFSTPSLLAPYAHATYLPETETVYFSNSPETLFDYHYKKSQVITRPIKGTCRREKGQAWQDQWDKMIKNPKESAELLMITDLLRNDLNRIEFPRAVVEKLKAPLLVPGIVHQYSQISLELEKPVSVGKLMSALFPGGSVTGAPKKRVMEIIQSVEPESRGFYCGSTLLMTKRACYASINIRSATFDLLNKEMTYGAGGGITLQSRATDEFQEMRQKVESFLTLLKSADSREKV